MRGLITGSILIAVLAYFLLFAPSFQRGQNATMAGQRAKAITVAKIANAMARASTYRLLVADFHMQHGYFPSHIDEVNDPDSQIDSTHANPDAQHGRTISHIEIANFGDVVMHIRGDDDVVIGKVTWTAFDDADAPEITWECHTTDFEDIQIHFPQCRYKGP